MGFFSGPIAVVPKDRRLVDRKRQKGRNSTETIGEADRMVGKRTNDARVESEEGCELKSARRSTNLRPIRPGEIPTHSESRQESRHDNTAIIRARSHGGAEYGSSVGDCFNLRRQ